MVVKEVSTVDQVTPQPNVRRILGNIFFIFAAITLPGMAWSLFGWVHILLPLIVFTYLNKYGVNIGSRFILAGAALALLGGVLSQAIDIPFFSFSMLPAGYLLARSGMQGDTPAYSGLKGMAVLAACWALLIAGIGAITGASLYGSLIETLNSGIDETLVHYQQNETLAPDAMMMLETTLQQMKVIVPIIMPAIFSCSALLTTLVTMVLGNRLVSRFCNREVWPQFRFWQLPDRLIWLGIVSAVLTVLLPGTIRNIAINLLILLSLTYSFQGFAVCVFFMNKWGVPALLRSFIYVMIAFQSFGTLLLLITGIADIWFDFRKLNPAKQASDEDTTDD